MNRFEGVGLYHSLSGERSDRLNTARPITALCSFRFRCGPTISGDRTGSGNHRTGSGFKYLNWGLVYRTVAAGLRGTESVTSVQILQLINRLSLLPPRIQGTYNGRVGTAAWFHGNPSCIYKDLPLLLRLLIARKEQTTIRQ